MKYKTFKDLEFKEHPICKEGGIGKRAFMEFDNGYGVSVVRFAFGASLGIGHIVGKLCAHNPTYGSYTSNENEWELAVFHNGHLCYSSGITEDVMGHLTSDQVTATMRQIQDLKKEKHKCTKSWE